MNVFVYSENGQLLLTVAKMLQEQGETPFSVPDFDTLQSLIVNTDPDIAFLDEEMFPKERIKQVQKHIFDILLDFPVTSITDPYFTDYRGQLTNEQFSKVANIVMNAAKTIRTKEDLSPKLEALLKLFLTHEDEGITTDYLTSQLWGENNEAHKKTLHTYIHELRSKLSETGDKYAIEKVAKSTYRLISREK